MAHRPVARLAPWFLVLALGIALGVAGTQMLSAQPQAIKRSPLMRADLTGVEGKEVIMTLLEAQPGAVFPAHIHPGDEFIFVIDGSMEGFVGSIQSTTKTGETFHAPREVPHGGTVVGAAPVKFIAVHVVDKGKPLMVPAPK